MSTPKSASKVPRREFYIDVPASPALKKSNENALTQTRLSFMVLTPSKFGSQINIKNNDNPTIVCPSKHVTSSTKGSLSAGRKSGNKEAKKENTSESDIHPSAKRKVTNWDDKDDAGKTVKKAKNDPKAKVATTIPVAPPAEDGTETMCEESKKKRNSNPGLRVINGKIYDSTNGTACHQDRQKTLEPKLRCTAINQMGEQCKVMFCYRCLLNRYGENAETIQSIAPPKETGTPGKGKKAKEHVAGVEYHWKCPVCRDICNCSFCRKKKGLKATGIMMYTVKAFGVDSVNDLLQKDINTKAISVAKSREHKEPKEPKPAKNSKDGPPKPSKNPKPSTSATTASMASTLPKPIEKVLPPSFHAIELMYSEPILWQRIQLREFLFRFGPLLKLEKKHIRFLDDAQHTWSQDFCTAVVTAMLKIVAAGDSNTVGAETLIDADAASQALKEVGKPVQGITDRGWNAVAELLRLLEVEGVPEGIPRGSNSSSIDAATIAPPVEKRVTRGAIAQPNKPKPCVRAIPSFSESDQLALINLLGECVLSTDLFRRVLASTPETLRVYEEVLRKELKKFKFQESLDNGARKALVMMLKEMRVRKDIKAVEKAQRELAVFEDGVGKKQREIEVKRVELMKHEEKLARRVEPIGRDVRGNVYWRFGDLMEGQKNLFGPSWGQSLVVIGMGCVDKKEAESKDEQGGEPKEEDKKMESKWWFVKGMEDVERLRKWVEYEALENWGPKKKRLMRKKIEVTEAKNPNPTVAILNPSDDEVDQNYDHDHGNGEIHQNSFTSDKTSRTVELDISEGSFAVGLTAVAAEEMGDEEEDQMTEEGVTRKEVQKLAEALEGQAMWLRVMGIKSDRKEEAKKEDDNGEKMVEKDG